MKLRLDTSFKKHEKFDGYTFETKVINKEALEKDKIEYYTKYWK